MTPTSKRERWDGKTTTGAYKRWGRRGLAYRVYRLGQSVQNAGKVLQDISQGQWKKQRLPSGTSRWGSESAQSESSSESWLRSGISVHSAGDVRLKASGAGEDSDLNLHGTLITADNDIHLQAEGDYQQSGSFSNTESESMNSSDSAFAGIAVTAGNGGAAFGATVNFSQGRGNSESATATLPDERGAGARRSTPRHRR